MSIEKGAVLKTWCRVKEITVDKTGKATWAIYFDKENKIQEIKAKVAVVWCNGFGTPRLLLNSKSNLFPDGLANSNGLVVRNLMIHPAIFGSGVFEEALDSHHGPMGNPL